MTRIQSYTVDEVVQVIAENEALLLVHFGSPLASSCDFVRKELETLAPVYGERVRLAEVELPLQDVDVLRRYAIEQVPTLLLFRRDEEVERLERIFLPEELRDFLDSCVSFYGGQPDRDALE